MIWCSCYGCMQAVQHSARLARNIVVNVCEFECGVPACVSRVYSQQVVQVDRTK